MDKRTNKKLIKFLIYALLSYYLSKYDKIKVDKILKIGEFYKICKTTVKSLR